MVVSIRVASYFRSLLWFGVLIITCFTGCRPPSENHKQIQIYAASSMKEVMQSAKQAFEAKEPGTKLVFNFAGSQVLRLQIEQGASLTSIFLPTSLILKRSKLKVLSKRTLARKK